MIRFRCRAKAAKDLANAKVQEWETIMHGFQTTTAWEREPTNTGWSMERVFSLDEAVGRA